MATRTKKTPNPSLTSGVDAFDPEELRNPPGVIERTDSTPWITIREVKLGAIVQYVMHDGSTIRPAIVVAFVGTTVNLQVFVDGSNDEFTTRGQHASSTLQDWKRGVDYDAGRVHLGEPDVEPIYRANSWHWDA